MDPDVKQEYLNELQYKKTSETADLFTTLLFKKGIKVEVSTNLDTSDGLYNGSPGIGVTKKHGKIDTVEVKFDKQEIGTK